MGLPRFETTTTLHRAPPAKMDFMLGMAAQVRARETVDGYVETYMRRNPAARKTMEAVVMQLTERASDLRFDHLGFLAFTGRDDTVPGVAPILHVFTQLGWTERDAFDLEDGLVHARWYQPPSKDFPMVVVRELRVDRFGEECGEVLRKYLTHADDDEELLSTEDVHAAAIVGAAPWNTEHIDDDDMELLTYYSPLLAWHLAHGYAAHQVAGSVNGLTKRIDDGSTRRINATVEDVRAVMEAASSHGGGCPMAADPSRSPFPPGGSPVAGWVEPSGSPSRTSLDRAVSHSRRASAWFSLSPLSSAWASPRMAHTDPCPGPSAVLVLFSSVVSGSPGS